jgi:molybdate transport system regulatory protein
MKQKNRLKRAVYPRIRVLCGEEIALGPGKVDLLEVVAQTGSLREAAERMGMSYMRAWNLVRTMNQCFKSPLVIAARGGRLRGGTTLTTTGKEALKLYRQLELDCARAMKPRWARLQKLLRSL